MANSNQQEQIVRLIAQYQRPLLGYIRSLVGQNADAEEVLQEVTLFIWRNADEFQLGTEFGAWAYKIAYFQVLAFRKKRQRQRLQFGDDLVEQLAQSAPPAETESMRHWALEQCLKKLPAEDRELVQLRYHGEGSMDDLAAKLGRSVKTAYRVLNRIHLLLLDCVQHTVKTENGA